MEEPCEQCTHIEQRPHGGWDTVLLPRAGGRSAISFRITNWECPVCGSDWRMHEKLSTGEVVWKRPE